MSRREQQWDSRQIASAVPSRAADAIWWLSLVTAAVFVADAAVSIASGTYLNLGSGVWLALARDTIDGVFYRELSGGGAYGGTRYFPALFVTIAGLMRAGVPPVTAGVAVSVAGLLALVAAIVVLLRRLGAPPPLVALGAALIVAPYFVHQTAFAIRCEPIAAAFAAFGLALLVAPDDAQLSNRRLLAASLLFAGAFATKMTCVYAPAAAVAALAINGRAGAAARVVAFTTTGAAIVLLGVHVVSGGRALDSFRACALAGSSLASLLSGVFEGRALMLIGTSHLLSVVFALAAVAFVLSPRQWRRLPALYLAAAAAITAVLFASPGTILTSQILDVYVAAVVFLIVVAAGTKGRPRAVMTGVLVAVALWAAAQNVVRIARLLRQDAVRVAALERRQLVSELDRCDGPVLSESPLVPVLAGERPVLLDPFAFHVVALNRPEIGRDLAGRVSRREFACVVIEQDPSAPHGRAWYQNVNLTGEVIDAVLQQYSHVATVHGQRIYRPRE